MAILANETSNQVPKERAKPFPKVMYSTSTGAIALFQSKYCAVILVPGDGYNTSSGDYSNNMDMLHFKDYNHPITIQND